MDRREDGFSVPQGEVKEEAAAKVPVFQMMAPDDDNWNVGLEGVMAPQPPLRESSEWWLHRQSLDAMESERAREKAHIVRMGVSLARSAETENELRQMTAASALSEEKPDVSLSPPHMAAEASEMRARRAAAKKREESIARESEDQKTALKKMVQQSMRVVEKKQEEEREKRDSEERRRRAAVAEKESKARQVAQDAENQKQKQQQQLQAEKAKGEQAFQLQQQASAHQEVQKTRSGPNELLASLQALVDAFPRTKIAQLYKLKGPITKALNQVTPDPALTISRAKDISGVLSQAKTLSEDVYRIVQFHLATQVCGMVLSKMGNKISNVFPYAAVTAFVCHQHPSCWDIISASLQSRSPYLVPTLEPRKPGESETAYKDRLGCSDENTYIREQNGFVTFYAALCCAQVSNQGSWRSIMPRMGELWRLLSAILNSNPTFFVPDIIVSILETAGPELILLYRRQTQKLLQFCHGVYLPMCRDKSKTLDGLVDKPLVDRLEILLVESRKHNYTFVPPRDVTVFKDFEITKKRFQMKSF